MFKGGEPYLRVGKGRPLVYMAGLTFNHTHPEGWERSITLGAVKPLVRAGFEVYFTNRAQGLPAGTTFADIAASHAESLADHFGEPVDVLGHSTGGSLALQLAADHPEVVRRVVVASAAYRLGPVGKRAQLELLRGLERSGRIRGSALAAGVTQNWVLRRLLAVPLRLMALMKVENPADPIAVLRGEDAFDVYERLGGIEAETLVICGGRDYFWTPEMFAETAHRMPHAKFVMYPEAGHAIVTRKDFVAEVTAFLDAP
ncbi:alpha/beta fold hydrolase [Streptosporangium sp. NPDC000396]|uniref:alpha/beta fold hydrolase n=1 Tax=Streptosporangium sp. NPDC000396 TaxID=3366185 RepID=UPI0036B6C125